MECKYNPKVFETITYDYKLYTAQTGGQQIDQGQFTSNGKAVITQDIDSETIDFGIVTITDSLSTQTIGTNGYYNTADMVNIGTEIRNKYYIMNENTIVLSPYWVVISVDETSGVNSAE